ncbi:MAG: WD40 repeat domain-containing protein [Fimbriimonas sp.]
MLIATIVATLLTTQTPTKSAGLTFDEPKVLLGVRPIAMAPAPAGSRVLLSLEDGSVRLFDAATQKTLRQFPKHPQAAYGATWSPDGKQVATGDESARIFISDAATGKKIRDYRTHTRGIQKLSFNLNGTRLLSTGKDDAVNIYDLTSPKPKPLRFLLGKGANLYSAVWNPKSTGIFAVATLTPVCRIVNAANMSTISRLVGHQGTGGAGALDLAYNPEGTLIASGGKDGAVRFFEAKSGAPVGKVRVEDSYTGTNSLAFSPNGNLLAAAFTDSTVRIWNTKSLALVKKIDKASNFDSPVAFTADGKWLLSRNDQGFLEVRAISPAQAGAVAKGKKVRRSRR